jgi:hypothetical protein
VGFTSDQQLNDYVRGLLDERRMAAAVGKQDQVDEINAELKRIGAAAETPRQAATKRNATKKKQTR